MLYSKTVRVCRAGFSLGYFLAKMGLKFQAIEFLNFPQPSCVADNKRSFALGMQTLFMRLFALPGPVIVGASVDRHCIAWEFDKCGRRKNCLDYDITLMSKKLVMLGSVTAAIGTALFALGWWFFPKMKSNDRNGSAETEDALQLVT